MRKIFALMALSSFVFMLFPMALLCQEKDITGTWIGKTYVPDQGEDGLTMIVEKEEDEYKATLSDDFGLVPGLEARDVSYEEGTLSFNFNIFDGYQDMTVWITLEVNGDKMSGYWETVDGMRDSIEMERK